MIGTQPNTNADIAVFQQHTIPLPKCCPVSGNPQPGSRIEIRYRAQKTFLEVYSLKKYIDTFVGGHPDGVRDMEGMIQQIAADCCHVLHVYVRVDAHIVLQHGDTMRIIAKARP